MAESFDILLFQSTLPVKGATTPSVLAVKASSVSIHAPSEGSDQVKRVWRNGRGVSIHAPSEGSDWIS